MAKKTSLKDIANKVGVSTALVSYVLNGLEKEKRVGSEVVKRIHQAAEELNYKPNQVARSLRKGSTNTIGLIVADISNPFFSQLARIIEEEAAKENFTVIYGSSDESPSKSGVLIETFINRQVDGLIITPSEGSNEHINSLVKTNFPFVLMDRAIPGINANHVILNNFNATYSAVNYLFSRGYKNIKMLAYKLTLIHMHERIRGYKEAMQDNKLNNFIDVREVRYDFADEDIEKNIKELIENNKTEALIFATNAISISGLYSIRKLGLKIPKDLAVIGFDGHEVFDFFNPQLTYIRQPLREIGSETVKVLIDRINGIKKTLQIELESQLVKRGSC